MKKFKNPISPRERKSSLDFVAPTKEAATTGRFMQAGDYYGEGFKNPVGNQRKATSLDKGPIIQKSLRLDPNEIV